jgi:hypothetical protein
MQKPGYKTTEFWLATGATLLSALFASGVLAEGSLALKIAGIAATVLGALGYAVVRGAVKKAQAKADLPKLPEAS